MTECEVQAVFDSQGQARPISLVWGGQTLLVVDVGRRWLDDWGQHLLARVQDGRVFELVYNAVSWQGVVVSLEKRINL